jgi:hypothetical protein
VNQNRSEGQTSDEALLVQRAIGLDAGAFGRSYDAHIDRVYGHRNCLKYKREGKCKR